MTTRMLMACLSVFVVACGGELGTDDAGSLASSSATSGSASRTYEVCPGPEAQDQLLAAIFHAQQGDTVMLCPGRFEFDSEIPIHEKRGLTLKGAGKDQTIVSFLSSNYSAGFSAARTTGLTIEGLTVEDANSTAVFIMDSSQFTVRDLRTRWNGYDTCDTSQEAENSCSKHGEIGMVIEFSRDILVEDSEFFGATAFGLGFSLPHNALVRRVLAAHNNIGVWSDNPRALTVTDSDIEANAVGVLLTEDRDFSLPGAKSVFTGNRIKANNTPNFARTGNGFAALPSGIGMLHVAVDQLEVTNNEFLDNGTTGLAIINAALLNSTQASHKYDRFPEGINVHANLFRDNGGEPGQPDPRAGPAAAFVPLVIAKNGGKAAQIAWDGATDSPNDCKEVPRDERGVPLDQPNPDSPRDAPRTDERGRPNFSENDPEPNCRYTMWKFDESGKLRPENLIYIDNNRFESTRPQTALVDDFVNFHLTSSNQQQVVQDLLVPASNDLSPHAGTLPSWPLAEPAVPYRLDPRSASDRVKSTQVEKTCAGGPKNQVNWEALLRYNCPRLSDYGLFDDPKDPRHSPRERGMLYKINSPLFSDYAVKYRFIFVPPGKKISYADYEGDPNVSYDNNPQRSMNLPVGSVIVKTFAFRTDDSAGQTVDEQVIETRLLIKRQEYDRVSWVGMAYRWMDTPSGRIAKLAPEGASVPVSFDYLDEDPDVVNADGQRRRYTGSTDIYSVPSASSCAACHGGTMRDPGASPISIKPRHLNREEHCIATGSKQNQLNCLVAAGMLDTLPDDPANLERTPRWNVPGDSGHAPGSPRDVHDRMRAYLEINCSYCHAPDGFARISRVSLDSFRRVDSNYGICRPPLLSGRFGDRRFDIEPGNAEMSVLPHRDSISSFLRMPPLARSLHNMEAHELMEDWINRALIDPSVEVHDTDACNRGGPPIALP